MPASNTGVRSAAAPSAEELAALLAEVDDPARFIGVLLVGSGARGALTRYSDLDLVLISREAPAEPEEAYRLCYRRERLISISVVSLEHASAGLSRAEAAVATVQGLRDAVILRDSEGAELAALTARARDFVWTPELTAEAHRTASYFLMGNAEEVHKVLRGLAETDDLALLNGAWGIALYLPKAVALFQGVLSRGDNLFHAQVCEAVGRTSAWARFHAVATGRAPGPSGNTQLAQQGIGAVWLYEETARLLESAIRPEHRDVIETAIRTVRASGLIPEASPPQAAASRPRE